MPLLDAILAFAVTMLVVATTVSLLVDVCHRLFALRKADFEAMLIEFNEQELKPVIDRELARLTAKLTPAQVAGIRTALANVEATPKAAALHSAIDAAFAAPDDKTASSDERAAAVAKAKEDLLQEDPEAVRIHLTTDELMEKLKRTELGTTILATLGDEAQAVFDEVAKRYEVIGGKFTAIFRKKARCIATLVAFGLAIALNIDTVNIMRAYMSDQTLREAVVAKYSQTLTDHDAAAKAQGTHDGQETEPENSPAVDEAQGTKDDQPTNPEKSQAAAEAQGTNDDQPTNLEKLKAAIDKAQKDISGLNSAGFPIGYSYFPWQPPKGGPKDDSVFRWRYCRLWCVWIAGIALTAFFAGLGSPFWLDIVRGLANVTQGAKRDKPKA